MAGTALVTGASSGIGMELARYHASKGGDLVITARREATLVELKRELEDRHGISVHVIACDLAAPGGPEALYDAVQQASVKVDILINNAGFGGRGRHVERELADEVAMIDLNILALVTLTHAFGGDMAARGSGRILNVGSTAGFMPGPMHAVYFASKAFVKSFSQAVDHELRGRGVTCTLLAPGYVETGFAKVAGLDGTLLARLRRATAASVARHGYEAMMRGKLVTINDWMLAQVLNWIVPFTPRRWVMAAVRYLHQK